MKDDILTAVTEFNPPSNNTVTNVAPIAPLPSRLSFCLSPQRQQQVNSFALDQRQTEKGKKLSNKH